MTFTATPVRSIASGMSADVFLACIRLLVTIVKGGSHQILCLIAAILWPRQGVHDEQVKTWLVPR